MKMKILSSAALIMSFAISAFAQEQTQPATTRPQTAQPSTEVAPATAAQTQQATNNKPKAPIIHAKQQHQQKRIANGVKSGELTPKETERLEKHEAKIQQDKKEAKSDGTMTPEERAKIRKEQAKTSQKIHDQKHDDQTQH